MENPLRNLRPVADAIALLLRPYAEVVLHDLATGRIDHIANPVSRREPGDPSLTDVALLGQECRNVIGPYAKTNPDGRPMKSITSVVRDDDGRPCGLVCINIDVSMFETMQSVARDFLRLDAGEARPSVLFHNDWREDLHDIVGTFVSERCTTAERLSPADRSSLIAVLDARGIFAMRNAVPYVARHLGLSRATLYKVLKASRGETGGDPQPPVTGAIE